VLIGLAIDMRHILILGGTAEARQLAGQLSQRRDLSIVLSLAGRTAAPAEQPVPVRIGGFGGTDGLAAYLEAQQIDLLIDATHPYAAIMSANAAEAAARGNVRLLALRRPPWIAVDGDQWVEVDSITDAVLALGPAPRNVFLTVGRKDIVAFAAAPQHDYLIRSVDPIDPPLDVPRATYLTERGPFCEADDRELMAEYQTHVVVAKNSGGEATYGKIAAARSLDIEVVMLRRPVLPAVITVETVQDAVAWLDHELPTTDRGV
jgi:precorrin-6A/cobalt-precorrin-6A reductase